MKLVARNLVAGYGRLPVLHDVSLEVREGQVTAILGANGAGKSTLMKTLAGFLPVMTGTISLDDQPCASGNAHWMAHQGVVLVPQSNNVFSELSVAENLRLGAEGQTDSGAAIERTLSLFPGLSGRANQAAGSLSGGERQALAIMCALLMQPSVLLLDEPTTGLAPLVANATAELVDHAIEQGVAVAWVVEQMPEIALRRAASAYFMDGGRVTFEGEPESLLAGGRLEELMLQHG